MSNPITRDWNSVSMDEDTCVTLGNFDGVHLGHVKILEELKEKSKALGLNPVIITFDPHPRHFFSREKISLLTTADEKMAKFNSLGFSDVYIIHFNKSLSELTPVDFFRQFLLERLRVRAIVIGKNHRFGKNARGDAAFLKNCMQDSPDNLTIVEPIEIAGKVVSSTLIRGELTRGNVAVVTKFLGYAFTYTGIVVEGEKRGQDLGYPTANIALTDSSKMMVAFGVYGGFVWLDGEKYEGIVNIGKKPTFPTQNTQIEVHILNFSRKIYGKKIHLELHFFLRNEKLFKSGEELSSQIHADLAEYKQILKKEKESRL